jgi:hypothetical protein
MKNCIPIFKFVCLLFFTSVFSQNRDIEAIKSILEEQQEAWSNNDLKGFMQGYWKSDSKTFTVAGG